MSIKVKIALLGASCWDRGGSGCRDCMLHVSGPSLLSVLTPAAMGTGRPNFLRGCRGDRLGSVYGKPCGRYCSMVKQV